MIGKTAATVKFVRDAEAVVAAGSDLTETETYQLGAKIERLKDGSESLEEFETVDDWLERLRDHHP
jgi:hypothetical protein